VTRTALLRAAVAPLLAAALGGAVLGAAGPALLAAPAQAAPATAATSPADDVADEDRPVQIDVGRFEPRTVTPGATVTVTGTFTNTGAATIDHLSVRLQRGDVLTSRAELAAESQDPDPATAVVPAFQPLPDSLSPGGKVTFVYSVAADQLQLDRDGVYPVLLNVNGAVSSKGGEPEQRRVGELSTYLVQQPVDSINHTAVAWLWPLAERTHRNAAGVFVDDDLTDSISEHGRLDRALAVVEQLPVAGSAPGLPVTLAIDPALIEELTVMAAGPYSVDGTDDAGRGTDAAVAFLERLAAVADVHPVVALPYGDVDADALQTAGLADVITRSLPGSPAGTAHQSPDAGDDDAGVPASSTGDGGAGTDETAGDGSSAGVRILSDALHVEPISDLAWAPDGALRADTLDTLRAGGVRRVVLGTGGLSEGETAVGLAGNTATARVAVSTPSGSVDGLVADAALGAVVGAAEQTTGGPRLAEQRYLAELAVLTQEAPAGTRQTVLVAPPRTVEAGPEGAGAMMADTTALPWLVPATVAELSAAPGADGGHLIEPDAAAGLDLNAVADVVTAVGVRNDLAGAVVGDAATALAGPDAAIARASSVAWRADPAAFPAATDDLVTQLERLRSQVTLVAPADGTYTLGSTDAPLVLTVRNDLPFPVEVRLDLDARRARGISISDIGVQTLPPGERIVLQVPTQVRQSGGFAVDAQLTTPDGAPLGDRIQLKVKSTAYGSISLLITIGAAALLGLLFLRRLVNFVLRRRRAGAAEPGAPVPLPPNRSPV
jgi:hypothetical protein